MIKKWLSPEGLMLIECWARDGLSLTQIAAKIGISVKCFWEWRRYYDEIEEALSKGKEAVDYEVENALLRLALGGEKKTTRTIVGNPDSNGNRQVRVETTVETVLPNATAALAWLNNRKPKDWKRNRDLFEIANEDDSSVTINVVRAGSGIKTSCDVQKGEGKKKQKVEERREARLAKDKRKREQEEEYEKARRRIQKEQTGNSKKEKSRQGKASNDKEELDENGWPIDWQEDEGE